MKISTLSSIFLYVALAIGAPTQSGGNATLLLQTRILPRAEDKAKCSKNGIFMELPNSNKRPITLDTCQEMPPKTCVRRALVALALWRDVCPGPGKLDMGCWSRAPSIDRCCGEWVRDNDTDSIWKDAALYHTGEKIPLRDERTGKSITIFKGPVKTKGSGSNKMHRVIKPGVDDYAGTTDGVCRRWQPASDRDYTALMQNLPRYQLYDANEKGEVLRSNGELIGYMP